MYLSDVFVHLRFYILSPIVIEHWHQCVVKAFFEADAGAEAELPRRGQGRESWEQGETKAEAATLRPRHGRWRLRPDK